MEIRLSNLKEQVRKFSDLVDNYGSLYRNYYYETKDVGNYWNTKYSKKFLTIINDEKKAMNNVIEDIEAVSNIYNYIIDKYSSIGDYIKIDFSSKDDLLNKFNNYMDRLQKIINLYKNLDVSEFDSYRKVLINDQMIKLEKEKEEINKLKDGIFNLYKDIEEVEKGIKNKISSVDISIVRMTDISNSIER